MKLSYQCLSTEYLSRNNLFANSELNQDKSVKGYFGKNGRVRAQQFRGSMSNGFATDYASLGTDTDLAVGDEFTQIDGVVICKKYIVPTEKEHARAGGKKTRRPVSAMFWKHWHTKNLFRKSYVIPTGIVYLEEKIHGTSARTGRVLCPTNPPWWRPWAPKKEWWVVSGTRNVDAVIHDLREIREEVGKKLAPYLHKGEQLYYEIFGNSKVNCPHVPTTTGRAERISRRDSHTGASRVSTGWSSTVSRSRPSMVTAMICPEKRSITEQPWASKCRGIYNKVSMTISALSDWSYDTELMTLDNLKAQTCGRSRVDADTMLEGVVVWFEDADGKWDCLKLKSDEFLLLEDKNRESGVGDVEDSV